MKNLLLTTYNTAKGLDKLNNKYKDDLYKKSFVLFASYFLISIFIKAIFPPTKLIAITSEFIILEFFLAIMSLAIWLLLLVFINYGVTMLIDNLGGKSDYFLNFILLAYAYFPVFLSEQIVYILKQPAIFSIIPSNSYARNGLLFLGGILALKILFIGLKKFNTLSNTQTIIATGAVISPVLLIFFVFKLTFF